MSKISSDDRRAWALTGKIVSECYSKLRRLDRNNVGFHTCRHKTQVWKIVSKLTLKAPITTAADHNFSDIFPDFRKKYV